jgi:hypothetical protein
VTRSDLEAESSAVFSTVIWDMVTGIYPGLIPGRKGRGDGGAAAMSGSECGVEPAPVAGS